MSEYVLVHHGTKGMRWGVRRYQNKDGSLTPAGRKRYGDEVHDGMSDDHVRARSKPISSMTDKELNDAMIRLQREKQYAQLYSELSTPKKSAGRKFAGKFVEKLGDKVIEKTTSTIVDKVVGPGADKLLGKAADKTVARIGRSARGREFMRNWDISTDRRIGNEYRKRRAEALKRQREEALKRQREEQKD